MFEDGLTIKQLEDVMRKIWEFYTPPQKEDDSGNVPKSTSSKTGSS